MTSEVPAETPVDPELEHYKDYSEEEATEITPMQTTMAAMPSKGPS